jgi:hypothetical protein
VHVFDAVAILFGVGQAALSRAEDLEALYWLAIGVVGVRAAVQLAKPGNA